MIKLYASYIKETLSHENIKIGTRVRYVHKNDSFPGQKRISNLDGKTGTIIYYNPIGLVAVEFDEPFLGGHNCGGIIKSTKGRWIPLELLELEPVHSPKIRWYNKGKLEENKLFDLNNNVGRRVKIKSGTRYERQAYNNNGTGYGTIIGFYDDEDPDEGLPYKIEWDSGTWNEYALKDFDFVDDVEKNKTTRTRWYNKGKLEERKLRIEKKYKKLNKINMDTINEESKIMGHKAVGYKIKLSKNSNYYNYYRILLKEDDIYGIILEYNPNYPRKYEIKFDIDIPWRNDLKTNWFNYKDIEILPADFKIPGKRVRWYKHGKFEEESEW